MMWIGAAAAGSVRSTNDMDFRSLPICARSTFFFTIFSKMQHALIRYIYEMTFIPLESFKFESIFTGKKLGFSPAANHTTITLVNGCAGFRRTRKEGETISPNRRTKKHVKKGRIISLKKLNPWLLPTTLWPSIIFRFEFVH